MLYNVEIVMKDRTSVWLICDTLQIASNFVDVECSRSNGPALTVPWDDIKHIKVMPQVEV